MHCYDVTPTMIIEIDFLVVSQETIPEKNIHAFIGMYVVIRRPAIKFSCIDSNTCTSYNSYNNFMTLVYAKNDKK